MLKNKPIVKIKIMALFFFHRFNVLIFDGSFLVDTFMEISGSSCEIYCCFLLHDYPGKSEKKPKSFIEVYVACRKS